MTVFYLLAVDLPSWVLGIDDRSLSCCVQSIGSRLVGVTTCFKQGLVVVG